MIAADTSVVIDYINGAVSEHTKMLHIHLGRHAVAVSPVVITELYGIRSTINDIWRTFIQDMPSLEIENGYWQRAGETRRKILQKGLKAKLGDALIAQSCIDHDIPLLTRDEDFRYYAEYCGLKLVKS